MQAHPPPEEHEARRHGDAERQTRSLAALAVILALLVGGLLLARTLHRGAAVEDCLLAGRRDCDRAASR
jgi:hypothetical protein